jgi:SRSO17 transposase
VYLPPAWAEDLQRRGEARVPDEVTLQPQPEMAWALLDQARAWGVPQRGVVADADDGDHPHFLAGLEARPARSVVGVRTDCPVPVGRTATSPVWRADALRRRVPRWQRRTVRWRQGPKGWLRKQFVGVRCWRVTSAGQRHVGRRLGERAARGQPEERQYDWSNRPASVLLEELAGDAHRRQAVAQFHAEAQGELGWDQDQGRLWPGVHRPAVTVMRACSFLVWRERRHRRGQPRRGRPRDPCPPSA